jgi:hypothetical protein
MRYPVVMKLLYGSLGKGVMFADTKQSAASFMDALERFNEPLFLEEYIENPGEDIRAVVVGGEVIGSMKRIAQKDERRTNIGIGGSGEPVELDTEMKSMALKAADAVVFANPVYFGELSESMRAFLDRLRRVSFGGPGGKALDYYKNTPTIGVCVAGGRGRGAPNCCTVLEKVLLTCGFDLVDVIPVTRQNLDFKLPILELTGEWLVSKPTAAE